MFDTLKKIFLSFILPEDEREGKAKEVMVEVKQKTLSFKSLFLLGDVFYAYHYDAKPANFATWLKKNHVDWSNQHAGGPGGRYLFHRKTKSVIINS